MLYEPSKETITKSAEERFLLDHYNRSRTGWRERALEAENRSRQLEIENHQLKNALTRVPELPTIDNTHFF